VSDQERCPTCGAWRAYPAYVAADVLCTDSFHDAPSTTQEAEKALEDALRFYADPDNWEDGTLYHWRLTPEHDERTIAEEGLAALRSLRTQLEQVTKERDAALEKKEVVHALHAASHKTNQALQERIEELEKERGEAVGALSAWVDVGDPEKVQMAARIAELDAFLRQHPEDEVYDDFFEENGTSRVCWAHREGQLCCIDHLSRALEEAT
jgi:hypothetical protein